MPSARSLLRKRLDGWADTIISGKRLAGHLQRLACERYIKDLDRQKLKDWEYKFNEDLALHVLDFCQFCRHSKGEWAGQPFVPEDWQAFTFANVFGWVHKATGLRRFRTVYEEIPRKNGKSTKAAVVGNYLFIGDNEAGAEVYAAATKKDQAKIVWGEAQRMVKKSPELREYVTPLRHNMHIESMAAKFEPLGADEDTLDGLNVHGAILDELHAHKTRGLYDVIDTATDARRQPLLYSITTAGFDKLSLCWDLHEYSEKVLEGITEDDRWFAFIASADPKDDWTDESVWEKANPNWRISVKPDGLRAKAKVAKETPAAQNNFRRLHLNQWTEQETKFLDPKQWELCFQEYSDDFLRQFPCTYGGDLGWNDDITSRVLLFKGDSKYYIRPKFWVPEGALRALSAQNRQIYDRWIEKGILQKTKGVVMDYDFVKEDAIESANKFNVREYLFDPWNATHLGVQCENKGLKVQFIRQSFDKMNEPTKTLSGLILGKKIAHDGNEMMDWMANNLSVETDSIGRLRPVKKRDPNKVDGMIALILALAGWLANPESQSIYEERGFASI